jgi:signal-transduction protein with cAMP-binding, CBS, and nucleotidyltransferase domain
MNDYPVGDLHTTLDSVRFNAPLVVAEKDSLVVVASALLEHGVSCAVLEEPPLRVVTEYDLAGAWAQGCHAADEVSSIATANPCWAPVSANVAEAAALMVSLGVRHLVVLDLAGRPIGMVSMSELFSMLIRTQEPIALYASFAEIMLRSGIDHTATFGDADSDVRSTRHPLGA